MGVVALDLQHAEEPPEDAEVGGGGAQLGGDLRQAADFLEQEVDDSEDYLSALWPAEYVVNGFCGLCGNSGIIDTTGTITAAGVLVGGTFHCICPNGRSVHEQVNDLPGTKKSL